MRTLVLSLAWLLVGVVPASSTASRNPATFEAVVRPYRQVSISAPGSGILESVHVDRGDRVTQGQLLATLESSVELSGVEIAQAHVEAQAAEQIAAEQLAQSERRCAQHAALHEDGVLSAEAFEAVASEKRVAELGLQKAREEQLLARLELKRAKRLLERRSIHSTVDGVVVDRLLSPGELVVPTADVAIVALAQLDPLLVDVRIPVAMLTRVQAEMRVEVDLEEPVAGSYEAFIDVVDPVADAASGTVGVRIRLPNADYAIPAGMRCRVTLPR